MEKFKQWIVSHKLVSIIIASVLVVGITLAIVLPLTLVHKHAFNENWSTDATYHWHVCADESCNEIADKEKHTFVNKNDATYYWLECSVCGYQQEKINATVSSEALANALQFKDATGVDYTNWEAANFDNLSNKVTKKIKLTANGFYRYIEEKLASEPLEGMYLNNGVLTYAKYERNDLEDRWTKTLGNGYYDNSELAAIATRLVGVKSVSTSTFSYNESNNTYSTTKAVNDNINDEYILKFANGKLVGVRTLRTRTIGENSSITSDISWTISYGNTTIEEPEDSEVITTVPYKTSGNKFLLENVNLVAGETKMFVFEVKADMLGSYDTSDVQVDVVAGEGETLPTLTIAIEDSEGVAITNDSATNGSGYFEGLSAGKYIVKITANEDCTGSLSIVFA